MKEKQMLTAGTLYEWMTDHDNSLTEEKFADICGIELDGQEMPDGWQGVDIEFAPYEHNITGYPMADWWFRVVAPANCKTEDERAARIKKLESALRPFAQPDLAKPLSGNVCGGDSPVFQRDKAILRLGDFEAARRALENI